MIESNQEGYQTLDWIINQSEQGLFLVIADEMMQEEIIEIYRQGMVKIYDYKQHPNDYFFVIYKCGLVLYQKHKSL